MRRAFSIWLYASDPEKLRVAGDVITPKLIHHLAHFIWAKAAAVRLSITKLAKPHDSRIRIARIGCECRISRLMDDTLRRHAKLISLY